MPILRSAWAAGLVGLVLGLLACACSDATPLPTPGGQPAAAGSVPASTLVVPTPSPTEVLPTLVPTPTPRVPLRIGVQLVPAQPQAGQEFVLRLTVSNDGDRVAHGIYIATSGPWERYTVLSVTPAGNVARDAAGWHIVSPVGVPMGGSVTIEVRARADQPADEQLTFAIRESDLGEN